MNDESGSGRRLRMIRLWAGFQNQNEFADYLGINYTTYNNYEQGYAIPAPAVQRIKRKLPWVTSDYVLDGDVSNAEIGKMEAELRLDPKRAG